jgi:hypothetical protein
MLLGDSSGVEDPIGKLKADLEDTKIFQIKSENRFKEFDE